MRFAAPLLAVAVLTAGCQAPPAPEAEVTLGDLVVAAPAELPAGTTVLGVTNEDSSHHDLAICRGDFGRCDEDPITIRVLSKPALARDPDRLPDETQHLVLGGQYRSVVEVDLSPGRYRFYCAIVNHAPRGMEAAVNVGQAGS